MAARHGTANRYNTGCRCTACRASHVRRAADYRQRKITGEIHVVADLPQCAEPQPSGPGPVERGVEAEIEGSVSEARPGLAQAALAVARILDNPRAINQHPAAAKALRTMLDELRAASEGGHCGRLAVVRAMATGNE